MCSHLGRNTRRALAAVVACSTAMGGCAGRGQGADAAAPSESVVDGAPAAGEAAPDPVIEDLRKYIDQNDPLKDLGAAGQSHALVMDEPGSGREVAKGARNVERPAEPDPAPAGPSPVAAPDTGRPPVVPDAPAAAPESSDEKLTRLVGELRGAIQENRSNGDDSSAEVIRLLALNMLDAGSAAPELRALQDRLTPGQQKSLEALSDLLSRVRDPRAAGAALDARRVAKLLSENADRLGRDRLPLRISSSALCTSVESFGRYQKFPSNAFLQGRAQPVIVYVALENFSQRAAGADGAGRRKPRTSPVKITGKKPADPPEPPAAAPPAGGQPLVVELTESVAIHTEADDLVVWMAPDASIHDVSAERRRDYYLVQRIDLPARLTLGKYSMKITIRDQATGASDETIIPFEIVADASLVRGD